MPSIEEYDKRSKELFRDVARVAEDAKWKFKQNRAWDNKTNFIYKCRTLDDVRVKVAEKGLDAEMEMYSEHRWRNFRRHDAWLYLILARHKGARPFEDPKDKRRDLYLPFKGGEITTDLKVSRYPRSGNKGMDDKALAKWYYGNQSQQNRHHMDNRLFVVGDPEQLLYSYEAACWTIDNLPAGAGQFEINLDGAKQVTGIIRHPG